MIRIDSPTIDDLMGLIGLYADTAIAAVGHDTYVDELIAIRDRPATTHHTDANAPRDAIAVIHAYADELIETHGLDGMRALDSYVTACTAGRIADRLARIDVHTRTLIAYRGLDAAVDALTAIHADTVTTLDAAAARDTETSDPRDPETVIRRAAHGLVAAHGLAGYDALGAYTQNLRTTHAAA